ncbi:hypothetical protein [Saccharothrix syringae]|uniref:Adenylate/guanylate cyclase domain-containing protein n=1 Tax=Saccharothrix syringae TaxID=103733 RepID=A0A5Q0GU19_SACSY|nr:hypothetical protein [Saccharothrix syringae]QFZ16990.1 hypothetical protein EKG83_05480 [Saccharothrix syringae]
MGLEPVSRSILVVDVEKSSDRVDTEKAVLRDALYRVLREGLDAAGLPGGACRLDDLGDGVLAVVDCEVLPVLDPLLDVAVDALARHNAAVPPPGWLRLRFGVHFGLVARDSHGWVGDAMTTAFRVVNGAGVKAVLKAAERAQSVVAVSDAVHESVVRHGYRGIQPSAYRRLVDDGRVVWVRVPGYAEPPVPAGYAGDRPPAVEPPPAKVVHVHANGNAFTVDSIGHVDARTTLGERS